MRKLYESKEKISAFAHDDPQAISRAAWVWGSITVKLISTIALIRPNIKSRRHETWPLAKSLKCGLHPRIGQSHRRVGGQRHRQGIVHLGEPVLLVTVNVHRPEPVPCDHKRQGQRRHDPRRGGRHRKFGPTHQPACQADGGAGYVTTQRLSRLSAEMIREIGASQV